MNEPPLRQDVNDPNYDYDVGCKTEILLDGVPQQNVISYDVGRGILSKYAVDDSGMLIMSGDGVLIENLSGVVSVRWRAE